MKTTLTRKVLIGFTAAGLVFSASSARAVLITESIGALSASANFSISGSNLTVVLTNTSAADVLIPADVLTTVFFNIPGGVTLSPVSASLTGGSTAVYGSIANVGNGYQYKTGLVGAPSGLNSAIGTAGFGILGPNGNFGPSPIPVNGLDYGILSAGDNTATGNGGVTGNVLVKNSVTFNLTFTGSLTEANFTNGSVNFQYGTALTEPNTDTPPPRVPDSGSTLILSGLALTALGFASRRFGRKAY